MRQQNQLPGPTGTNLAQASERSEESCRTTLPPCQWIRLKAVQRRSCNHRVVGACWSQKRMNMRVFTCFHCVSQLCSVPSENTCLGFLGTRNGLVWPPHRRRAGGPSAPATWAMDGTVNPGWGRGTGEGRLVASCQDDRLKPRDTNFLWLDHVGPIWKAKVSRAC